MSESIISLYEQLQRFSHLQQLHSVLSRDLRASRDRVLKESQAVRKELTFFRWCMRKRLDIAYPFNNTGFQRSMDYDRLIFYRRLISYLHDHPSELGTIIVSLKEIRKQPNEGSLESLYFDNEHNLAECVCFDIMSLDINALVLLLRMILKGSKNFTRLSQQLFQLFIIITCHKAINNIFRPCLDRLNQIKVSFAEQGVTYIDNGKNFVSSGNKFFQCMNDVLLSICEFLRVMPIPLRQVVSVMKERVNDSPGAFLEWLLSTIFSPLLLNPDDWYLVIGNPPFDHNAAMYNIQTIVTDLLKMATKYQQQQEEEEETNDEKDEVNDAVSEYENMHMIDYLLLKHGKTMTVLLRRILDESDALIIPSNVVIPTSATPDLFTWHKIFLTIEGSAIGKELRKLAQSVKPPNIPNRPWITIALPTFSKTDDITNDGAFLMNLANEDHSKQPKSKFLKQDIAKPLRMFLLSLTEAQARAIPASLFTDDAYKPSIKLTMQQSILLHEVRGRIQSEKKNDKNAIEIIGNSKALNNTIDKIADEYKSQFCSRLEDALSTKNVLKSLNYLQTKETSLRELKVRAVHAHENLQVRDILNLSKPEINTLKGQLQRIANDQLRSMQDAAAAQAANGPNSNVNNLNQGSDWQKDRFVVLRTHKWISKSRNALIRFLNDYGIGKVDFKNKFGGSVLNFQDKRVSTILVNAIIVEIQDIFWKRCPIEDGKFHHQVTLIGSKFNSFDKFYDAFLEKNLSSQRPRISNEAMKLLIDEMSKLNDAVTVDDVESAISNCKEMLVAAINGADSATGDDYMPLLCYIIVESLPQHLPSQLQTVKTISQRKVQNKYFIDICVAMKALRNFANVVFPSSVAANGNDTDSDSEEIRDITNTTYDNSNTNNNNNNNNGIMGRIGRGKDGRFSTNRSRSRSRSKSPFNRQNSNTNNNNNNNNNSNNGNSNNNNNNNNNGNNNSQFLTAVKAKLPTKKSLNQMGGIGMQKLKQFGGSFQKQLHYQAPQQAQQSQAQQQQQQQQAATPHSTPLAGNSSASLPPKSPPANSPPKIPDANQNQNQSQSQKQLLHRRMQSDALELGNEPFIVGSALNNENENENENENGDNTNENNENGNDGDNVNENENNVGEDDDNQGDDLP